MEYRGLKGELYHKERKSQLYHGRILGIDQWVDFEANTIQGLGKQFKKAVDKYLDERKYYA